MDQSQIIDIAEAYARKIVADFRKLEAEQRIPDHWGYLDEDNNVVPCHMSDLLERYNGNDPFGENGMKRHLWNDHVGPYWVSTIFLGLDHAFLPLDGHSIWFETMVFRGNGLFCRRYETYAQAYQGHMRVFGRVLRWQRWLGYSRAHLRKIKREYRSRGKELGEEEGVFI